VPADQSALLILLGSVRLLQILDHLGLSYTVVEEEPFNFLGEPLDRYVLQVKSLYEVLKLDVFIFFHRLHYAWTKMSLLLDLVRNPLELLLGLPFFPFLCLNHLLSVLVSLFHNFE